MRLLGVKLCRTVISVSHVHAKPFTREVDFWIWLCCIIRCVVVDHCRHIKRRSLLMEKYAHWRASRSDDEAAWHPSNQHTLAFIDEALAKLPDEDAALLLRKYCDGTPTDELASSLARPPRRSSIASHACENSSAKSSCASNKIRPVP